jgi:hypothetical protein
MSESHVGQVNFISEEKWEIIKDKSRESWANEPKDSERRKKN